MNAPERPSGSFLRLFESKHCFGSSELIWDGLRLRLRTMGGRVMATVEEDKNWRGMWRVRFGGNLSDMANLSWTKDAAISISLLELNAGRFQMGNPAYRERDKTWAEGSKID